MRMRDGKIGYGQLTGDDMGGVRGSRCGVSPLTESANSIIYPCIRVIRVALAPSASARPAPGGDS